MGFTNFVPPLYSWSQLLPDLFYVVGGQDNVPNYLDDVDYFSPLSGAWAAATSMPNKKHSCSLAGVGDYLYSIAGYDDAPAVEDYVERMDVLLQYWVTHNDVSAVGYGGAAAHIGAYVYQLRGYTSAAYVQTMYRLEVATDTWAASVDRNFGLMNSCLSGFPAGYLFASGGYNGSTSDNADEYDVSSSTWFIKTDIPEAKFGQGGGFSGSAHFNIGGWAAAATSTNYGWDRSTSTWSTNTAMSAAYWAMAGDALGNTIMLATGKNAAGTKQQQAQHYEISGDAFLTRTNISSPVRDGAMGATIKRSASSHDAVFNCMGFEAATVSTCEKLDRAANTWSTVTSGAGLRKMAAGSINDFGYSWGDHGNDNYNYEHSKVGDSWSFKTVLNTGTSYASGDGLGDGDTGLVYHGFDNEGGIQAYSQSADAWTDKTGANYNKWGAAGAASYDGDTVFATAGYDADDVAACLDHESYAFVANAWTALTDISAPARYYTAGATGGFGAYSVFYGDPGQIQDTDNYTISTDAWAAGAAAPTGREQLGAVSLNGCPIAIGGYVAASLKDVEEYDHIADAWTSLTDSNLAKTTQANFNL